MKEDKKTYPFRASISLLAEGLLLAKTYRISFNALLTLLLENAIEEWSVPTMEELPRPTEMDGKIDDEKALT